MSMVRVSDIAQRGERSLWIRWSDGVEQELDVVTLRRRCPCAECVDEWTGKRQLQPAAIPETVRPVVIDSVGRYALQIHFNDGHRTGIYTFDNLRRLNA